VRFVELEPDLVRLMSGAPASVAHDEARIAVKACGICGTDLHLLHGMVMPPGASYPVRPGHEVAGVVTEIGMGVSEIVVGDAVVLHPLAPCGICEACRSGAEQRCDSAKILGIHSAGGMADETVWPASRLVKSGELPFEQAALLPDAVATAWHALSRANVSPGGTLVVLGAGGVGTHVLQLAHAIDPSTTLAAVVRSRASADRVSELNLSTVLEG